MGAFACEAVAYMLRSFPGLYSIIAYDQIIAHRDELAMNPGYIYAPILGLEPGCFFGASALPSRAVAAYRLTVETPTPKARATSTVGMPRSLASTIFFLRSSE